MVFDVSKDRRYLQLENMVVDLETGIKFTLDSAHPAFICEMFKNQFAYSYKHKLSLIAVKSVRVEILQCFVNGCSLRKMLYLSWMENSQHEKFF